MGETLAEYSRAPIQLHQRIEGAEPTVAERRPWLSLARALWNTSLLSVYGMIGYDMS